MKKRKNIVEGWIEPADFNMLIKEAKELVYSNKDGAWYKLQKIRITIQQIK